MKPRKLYGYDFKPRTKMKLTWRTRVGIVVLLIMVIAAAWADLRAQEQYQIHADRWVTEDSSYNSPTGYSRVNAWLDSLTRMRARQNDPDKAPGYKMTAAYSHGDDANLLNGYCVVRFDGNDLLKMQSATSYSQRGTIYLVFKPLSDSPTTQTLFSTTDENTANTYLQVQRNASTGRMQFRCRNGGSDTETLVTSAAAASPVNTWKIVRIVSDGANITFAVSDGSGHMAASTGSVSGTDGRWFGDIDGSLWRDSTVIGALVTSNGETNQFNGDLATVLVYDGDVTANHTQIETALFTKYGAL